MSKSQMQISQQLMYFALKTIYNKKLFKLLTSLLVSPYSAIWMFFYICFLHINLSFHYLFFQVYFFVLIENFFSLQTHIFNYC